MQFGWQSALKVILLGMILLTLAACLPVSNGAVEPPGPALPTQSPSTGVVATQSNLPTPTSASVENTGRLVLTMKQVNQLTEIAVGQVVSIFPPDSEHKWQIDFSPSILKPLDPADLQGTPAASGWSFVALAPGEGQIVLTSVVACKQPPCPPLMPIRFEFRLQVK